MATTLKYKSGDSWIDILHPIGSCWISHQSTSPADLFGGTWTQITGAVLRAADNYGYDGTDSHTLTVNEMPSHRHSSDALANASYWLGYNAYGDTSTGSGVNYGSTSNQYSIRIAPKVSTSVLSELRGGGASLFKASSLLQYLLLGQNCVEVM